MEPGRRWEELSSLELSESSGDEDNQKSDPAQPDSTPNIPFER